MAGLQLAEELVREGLGGPGGAQRRELLGRLLGRVTATMASPAATSREIEVALAGVRALARPAAVYLGPQVNHIRIIIIISQYIVRYRTGNLVLR